MKIIPDFASVSSYRKTVIFPAVSVKERNCAAADLEKWIITYRIDFCHFLSQCEQFSSKMSRGERGLGANDMKVYFQERRLGFSSPN